MVPRPVQRDCLHEFISGGKTTAILMSADEIRVAESTYCRCSILLPARPQIASGKSAEHSRSACLCALALQRIENFVNNVCHALALIAALAWYRVGSAMPASEKPFLRSWQES